LLAALDDELHVRAHAWSASDVDACATITGAVWNEADSKCTTRFIAYAYEPAGDGVGNDNFLCEPLERCILNRNRGVYVGHGELETLTVGDEEELVQIPGFDAITLERHSQNGA
jgi:hypothetical protein